MIEHALHPKYRQKAGDPCTLEVQARAGGPWELFHTYRTPKAAALALIRLSRYPGKAGGRR